VIIVLILWSQPVPADVAVQRLRGGLWQTVAMAIGFAVSIPLYLIIGQRTFALWAAAAPKKSGMPWSRWNSLVGSQHRLTWSSRS
jgi:hypothetical protein